MTGKAFLGAMITSLALWAVIILAVRAFFMWVTQ